MKDILFFYMPGCPHCRKAEELIAELLAEHPQWKEITIHRVDETANPAYADQFDYYYVPTFYVDGQKRMEGVPSLEKVRAVLDEALDGEGE